MCSKNNNDWTDDELLNTKDHAAESSNTAADVFCNGNTYALLDVHIIVPI